MDTPPEVIAGAAVASQGSAFALLPATIPPPPPDRNPFWAYIASRDTAGTQRAVRYRLNWISRIITDLPADSDGESLPDAGQYTPWHMITPDRALWFRSALIHNPSGMGGDGPGPSSGYEPAYINVIISALRGVLGQAWKMELITTDHRERAFGELKKVKAERRPYGRQLGADEPLAMIAACDPETEGLPALRDRALIGLLVATGMREASAVGVWIENYNARTREVVVLAKGNVQAAHRVHENAAKLISAWLAAYGKREGPMFPAFGRWGHIYPRSINPSAAHYIWNRRRKQAGLPPSGPHDARRTFTSALFDAGLDLGTIMTITRRKDVETLLVYDVRAEKEAMDQVDELSILEPGEVLKG
jgi:integrase